MTAAVGRVKRGRPREGISRGPIAIAWPVVGVVVTVALAIARLAGEPRFYFADDTQYGAFGQWYELGDRLLSGSLPLLNPSAWQAGNYAAEGQWGLLNPATWIVAVFARLAEDAVIHVTVVKLFAIGVMALGSYLLSRSFGAAPPWAAVAAVLVPAAGFTMYMDAPSWVTGLFCSAVLPWAWWGLRRTVEVGRSPLPYAIASYLLITFGYVYGAIILVVILVESLVRALIRRRRPAIVSSLLASVWGALLTITVYLPGILTAPVTERSVAGILNTGFLNADLTDLLSAAAPLGTASVYAWGDVPMSAPLVYIAWILPLFVFTLPVARTTLREIVPLLVLGAVMLLAVIGPSQIGPIRWPVRFMPFLALAVIIVFVVSATTTRRSALTVRRAVVAIAVVVVAAYVSSVDALGDWRGVLLVALVQIAAVLAVVLVARRPAAREPRIGWHALAAGAAIAVTALCSILQISAFPRTPLPVNAVPASIERMTDVLADASGDVIVVGDAYAANAVEESFDERLVANLWYLSPAAVANLYTVLPFSAYAEDLCIDLRGSTCADALTRLFDVDPSTGLTVADLAGVSTIVGIRETFPEPPTQLPTGWSVADVGTFTWTIERDSAVPAAGGVVWTGEGTRAEVREQSELGVSFVVEEVGADPRVVLSRLPWPGYAVDGARQADPIRGWLLTVDVSDASPGDVVRVSFLPPGFAIEAAAYVLAALLLVGWVSGRRVLRRRQSREGVGSAAGPASSTAKV